MPTSKTFRCYAVYQKGTTLHPKGKKRNGPFKWITAMDRDRAIAYFEIAKYVQPRKKEHLVKIVATVWKEDRALRAQGAKELPLKFD